MKDKETVKKLVGLCKLIDKLEGDKRNLYKVVDKLEQRIATLEKKLEPKQLEFPFPEKTMQDPTPPEMDSYFGGHLGMKKEVIEDGIVAFTLDPKKI